MLVLHGLTSTPQSVRSLAEAFASAGFTVELPLLPGHGGSTEDLLQSRWSDWAKASEEACAELVASCESVVVAGLSMGASLALWLASRHAEIEGVVAVNPLLVPPDGLSTMLSCSLGQGLDWGRSIASDIADPSAKEIASDGVPLEGLRSLFEAAECLSDDLFRVRCPVLLFTSRVDHVVPCESGDLVERSVRGPVERVWLERSYHVATLDYDSDYLEEGAVRFVRRVQGISWAGSRSI